MNISYACWYASSHEHAISPMIILFLEAQCTDKWPQCVLWIGGNDRDKEGSFVWSSDNKPLDFNNWSPVQPNSYTGNEDCIGVIYPGGKWADFRCTLK